MNWKLRAIQVGFRKGRGTRDQIVSIFWIIERSRKFQKNIICCFTDYIEPLAVWIITNWKTLKEMGIPDHHTCLLRNLCVGQEARVKTLYGTTDWFKIEKGVWQGCLLSICLFDLCTEHIMRNAWQDKLQAGIKIGRRNIKNLRYVDDNYSNGRKWRGTKEPLVDSERGEWKSCLNLVLKKTKTKN